VLASYIANTQNLLQLPGAPASLYTTANLTSWINISRGQLSGESQSIRVMGTISTVIGQRNYNFSAINIGTPSVTGAQGVIHVRRIMYGVGTGYQWMRPRNWEWFDLYKLNNPVPPSGPPVVWAQYGQGSAGIGSITGEGGGTLSSGSFYIDPLPDQRYTLNCDCVCYPQALVLDTDVEAIPYLWTDAVPYFAAWYALLSAQTSERMGYAKQYYEFYKEFVRRARMSATPDVNKYLYQQVPNPTTANKIGAGGGQ